MSFLTFHSKNVVYYCDKNKKIIYGEAYLTINQDTGLITNISTVPPPSSSPPTKMIELNNHLLIPGAIDVYSGSTHEQEDISDINHVYKTESKRIERITFNCARSGITTIVESPLHQIFPDTVPSTASKLQDKWDLINSVHKYVDYGLLASVEDTNNVENLSKSGHCLGLMAIVGTTVGPKNRSPRVLEPLKIVKVIKDASKYHSTTMKGALFVKAEHYNPKHLRLASPLRECNIENRRDTNEKIDHPAYMLAGDSGGSGGGGGSRGDVNERGVCSSRGRSSFHMREPDGFNDNFIEVRPRAGSALGSINQSSLKHKQMNGDKNVLCVESNDINDNSDHDIKNDYDINKRSSSCNNLYIINTSPLPTNKTYKIKSPTVQTIGGLRKHSFSAFRASSSLSSKNGFGIGISSNHVVSTSPNKFVSALLSEELKSYESSGGMIPAIGGSSSRGSRIGGIVDGMMDSSESSRSSSSGRKSSCSRRSSLSNRSGRFSRSLSISPSSSTSTSPSTSLPKSSPLQFGSMLAVETSSNMTDDQLMDMKNNITEDGGGKDGQIKEENIDSDNDDSRPSFELLVQHANVSTKVKSSPSSTSSTSSTMIVKSSSSAINIPEPSNLMTWENTATVNEFLVSPPKLSRMNKSFKTVPSLLERRRMRARASKNQQSNEFIISNSNDVNNELDGINSSSSNSGISHKLGSFGDAPGFNVSPLQVFKVPDTLTTAAISANYTIYISQRPESAEIDAVRAVVEGIPKTQRSSAAANQSSSNTIPLHFCNVSSANAAGIIESTKRTSNYYDITVGTSPHFLHLSSEELCNSTMQTPDNTNYNINHKNFSKGSIHPTLAKCSPPIRNKSNQILLHDGIKSGSITSVSSYTLDFELRHKMMHTNDLIRSIGGIDGIETLVSSSYTFCKNNNYTPINMVNMISTEPARLLGLDGIKGILKVGAHADMCIIDP
jgi:dihydroorotase-like cyclic amidohydrolase